MQVHAQIGAVWMNKFCWSKNWSLFWHSPLLRLRHTHETLFFFVAFFFSSCVFRLHSWHGWVWCVHIAAIELFDFVESVNKIIQFTYSSALVWWWTMYIVRATRVLHHVFEDCFRCNSTACVYVLVFFSGIFCFVLWPSIFKQQAALQQLQHISIQTSTVP